jgi:hypothetical protein
MIATVNSAATSRETLDAVQQIDCREAWGPMSAEAQAEVGSLAIRQGLLSLAAATFEGNIVYLDAEHRDAVCDLSQEIIRAQDQILWDALPDLYGISPCPEHPNGTDPFWATPMQREDDVAIEISWGVEPDGTAGSTPALSVNSANELEEQP